jgi:hypothetical protein
VEFLTFWLKYLQLYWHLGTAATLGPNHVMHWFQHDSELGSFTKIEKYDWVLVRVD